MWRDKREKEKERESEGEKERDKSIISHTILLLTTSTSLPVLLLPILIKTEMFSIYTFLSYMAANGTSHL